MEITKAFVALGAASVLVMSGCSGVEKLNKVSRCDHVDSKVFTVKIKVSKDTNKEPKAIPETVVACFDDEILFETVGVKSDFKIIFKNGSPFEKDLSSKNGKTRARVKVKPRFDEEGFKYDVEVPGYPTHDPLVRIKTR